MFWQEMWQSLGPLARSKRAPAVQAEPLQDSVKDTGQERQRHERDQQSSGSGRPVELALEGEEIHHCDGIVLISPDVRTSGTSSRFQSRTNMTIAVATTLGTVSGNTTRQST